MNQQDEKFLNTFQFFVVVLLVILAVKFCSSDDKKVKIESCKPIGCLDQ